MKSLYVHIPFCDKKCFYCSFIISVGQKARVDQYLDALSVEAMPYKGEKIKTIYVGGGTPSYLDGTQIQKLFHMLYKIFDCKNVSEITFEINPESIELEKAKLLRHCGVNRASCGVQTFNPEYLKFLGRNHSAEDAKKSVETLKKAGFDNINTDFIFSLPHQTEEEILKDIQEFESLNCPHISLYALTIEENTRFFTRKLVLPGLEAQADQYSFVKQLTEKSGYNQYEVSNFARAGFESKHNLNYWEGGEYIGLGVGAHSYLNHKRFWNVSNFLEYLKMLQKEHSAVAGEEMLDEKEELTCAVLFGLRMNKGIDLKALEKKYRKALDEKAMNVIDDLVKEGYMYYESPVYKVSDKGRLVLDEISVRLL